VYWQPQLQPSALNCGSATIFLLGREFGKIDAGELGGANGVLDEDLAGVVESFHSDVADGQAEKRADSVS